MPRVSDGKHMFNLSKRYVKQERKEYRKKPPVFRGGNHVCGHGDVMFTISSADYCYTRADVDHVNEIIQKYW